MLGRPNQMPTSYDAHMACSSGVVQGLDAAEVGGGCNMDIQAQQSTDQAGQGGVGQVRVVKVGRGRSGCGAGWGGPWAVGQDRGRRGCRSGRARETRAEQGRAGQHGREGLTHPYPPRPTSTRPASYPAMHPRPSAHALRTPSGSSMHSGGPRAVAIQCMPPHAPPYPQWVLYALWWSTRGRDPVVVVQLLQVEPPAGLRMPVHVQHGPGRPGA